MRYRKVESVKIDGSVYYRVQERLFRWLPWKYVRDPRTKLVRLFTWDELAGYMGYRK